jgi:hypothetical protein
MARDTGVLSSDIADGRLTSTWFGLNCMERTLTSCNEYDKFDEERKHLSPTLFSTGTPVQRSIPLFESYHIPCNVDPWIHYGSIIEWTLRLDFKFKLKLPERLSLLRAMAVTPNSAYLFVAAASTILQTGHLNPNH